MEQYRFHEAAQVLWHFFWHEFCDWYVELKKVKLRENSGLNADWRNILAAFETALRLLHPAMPFLTEELWQRLGTQPRNPVSIALAPYPAVQSGTRRSGRRAGDAPLAGSGHDGPEPARRHEDRSEAAA